MTDILCSWLNDDIGISAIVRRDNFASVLQNGYHFAEVFYKYGFQVDLDLFSARKHDDVLVRNYSMLRPAFSKIGVEITPWKVAQFKKHNQREIRNLAYDLFVGMRRFVKQQEGPSKSQLVYSSIEKLSTPAGAVQKVMPLDLSDFPGSAKSGNFDEPAIMTSIIGSTPNLAAYRKKKKPSKFSKHELEKEKYQTVKDINDFEMSQSEAVKGKREILPAIEYMNEIRRKAKDARVVGQRRAERRRRVLVDSIQNVFDDSSRARDIQLVERVSRVSILERRLTADLVATKEKEKQILRDNRIRLNKEFEQQRQQQFMNFLDAEAEQLRVQKLEEREQANKEIEEHKRRRAEKRAAKHAKNKKYARTIADDIVDIAMTISFYDAGTNKKVPKKIIKELREKFHKQLPIEEDDESVECEFAQDDYERFTSAVEPWHPEEQVKCPVVEKVKVDISEILKPEEIPEEKADPIWPLRIAVLGKPLSEHEFFVEKFAENHPVVVRKFVDMVKDCIDAFENDETVTHHLTETEAKGTFEVIASSTTSTNPSRAQSSMVTKHENPKDADDENAAPADHTYDSPSDRAKLGAKISATLAEGGFIDDETAALIGVEEARRIQKSSGFIFVDFPKNAQQLEIFEKELSSLQSIILIEKEDAEIIKQNVASVEVAADVSLDIFEFEEKWQLLTEKHDNCKIITNSCDSQITYDKFEHVILDIMNADKEVPDVILEPQEPVQEPEPEPKPITEPLSVPETVEKQSRPSSSKKSSRKSSAKSKERKSSAQSSRPSSKGSSKKSKKGKEKKEEEPSGPVPGENEYQWLSINDDRSDDTKGFYYRLQQSESDISNVTKKRFLKIFRNIHFERREIVRYLAVIMEDFPHFLNRPDMKQAYIDQFQENFNNQPSDLREDEEFKRELHEQLAELTEQLYQVGDRRHEENNEERVKLMTSKWLEERLGLIVMHFTAMLKAIVLKCAVDAMIIRKHFAFQANAPLNSASVKKEIVQTKALEKCEFDVQIETGEPMDGESVVGRASMADSIQALIATIVGNLEEISQSESKTIDEISLEKAEVPEAAGAKKDDKKRGKSPKGGKKSPSGGKSGKKGAKTSAGVSPEPDLKLERLNKAKNEAKFGVLELVKRAKAELQIISRNLHETTESSICQFEACFGRMSDMISIAQASEMTAVEEASAFIKAAIENDTPLRNPFKFGASFEIIHELDVDAAESLPAEEVIDESPKLELIVDELMKLNSYDLSTEQMHEIAKDLGVKKELVSEADGDWRILALAAVTSKEESEIVARAVTEGTCKISLEDWVALVSPSSLLWKIGRLLADDDGILALEEINRILLLL